MVNATDSAIEQRVWIHSLAFEIRFDEIKAAWNNDANRNS